MAKVYATGSVPKLFCAAVLLITVLGVVGSASPVFFPDSQLEKAVRETIGKSFSSTSERTT